ncbi:MAG: hypothetical protein FWF57_06625 [Defluviitaleaceae bacterium]|nr:hypothetical protein [Defluviitaleaceae bacterium]
MLNSEQKEMTINQIFAVSLIAYKKNFKIIFYYTTIIVGIIWLISFFSNFLNTIYYPANSETISIFETFFIALVTGSMTLVFTNITLNFLRKEIFTVKKLIKSYKFFLKFIITLFIYSIIMSPLMIGYFLTFGFIQENILFVNLVRILILILMIHLSVSFVFSANLIVQTSIWGLPSLIASYKMVKGRWFKTATILLLCFSTMYLLMEIISFLLRGFGNIGLFIIDFFTWQISSYLILTMSFWYLDRIYNTFYDGMIDISKEPKNDTHENNNERE